MAKVILLSDNLAMDGVGMSRYMGPYVIASQLNDAGYETVVIDWFTRIPNFFDYLSEFLSQETIFVGISATFLSAPARKFTEVSSNSPYLWMSDAGSIKAWLAKLRLILLERAPMAKIVLGGAKAGNFFLDPTAYSPIDYLVMGEFDSIAVDFVRKISSQQEPKFAKSVAQTKIISNSRSDLPRCPEMRFSSKFAIEQGEALPVEVSRGCIFSCKFCYYDKKRSDRKDLRVLREELIRNYELFGTTYYHFCDDCFNDSRRKVEQICGVLLALPFKVEWISYARVDVAVRFPETMQLMVESGARGLYLGLESFNPEVARRAGKGTPPDLVKQFLVDFQKQYSDRCLVQGSFIVGLPGESRESIEQTRQWLNDQAPLDFLNIWPLYVGRYHESFDRKGMDFSDYSRDPVRFGIAMGAPHSGWSHEEMNETEATDLAATILKEWIDKRHRSMVRSIWQLPALHTLGFTWADVLGLVRGVDANWGAGQNREIHQRFQCYLERYWGRLLERHGSDISVFPDRSRNENFEPRPARV